MGTYLMMLYVTIDQEEALKKFFLKNDWTFCKPDLSALTEEVGPPLIPKLNSHPKKLTQKESVTKNTKNVSVTKNTKKVSDTKNSIIEEPPILITNDSNDVPQEGCVNKGVDVDHADDDDVDHPDDDDDTENVKVKQVNSVKDDKVQHVGTKRSLPESPTPRKSFRLSQKRKPSWSTCISPRKKSESKVTEKKQKKESESKVTEKKQKNESESKVTEKKQKKESESKVTEKKQKKESDVSECQINGQLFPSDEKCPKHQALAHEPELVEKEISVEINGLLTPMCFVCKEEFEDCETRDRHCLEMHQVDIHSIKEDENLETLSNTDGLFVCSICQEDFTDEVALKTHCKQEHGKTYYKKGHPRYSCSVCEKVFISLKCFKTHIERHKVRGHKPKESVESYFCIYCTETFDRAQIYKRHLKEAHNETLDQVGKVKMHMCEFCGKTFRRADYIKEHRNVVHLGMPKKYKVVGNDKNNVCEICGSKFKRKCHLEEHIALKHGKRPPLTVHPCTHCSKTFHRPSKLEYHINKEHLHSKPYSCKKCSAKFYSKVTMTYHVRACEMSEDSMITCEHCGKKYKSNHNYKLHIQAVHSDPALVCACGTVVRWQSSVTKHKRRCPLNAVNLGENNRVKKEQTETENSIQHINISEAEQFENLHVTRKALTTSVKNETDQSTETIEISMVNDDTHVVAAQVDAVTSVLTYSKEATQVNNMHAEGVQEVVHEATIDEHIMSDLISGVEEQVVEISSTPQINAEPNDGQRVYYVILKK